MTQPKQTKADLGYEIYNCTYRITQEGFSSDPIKGKISIGSTPPDEMSDDHELILTHFTPERIKKSGFKVDADPSFEILEVEGYEPETFQIPASFPPAPYYAIPGTHYILLPDGNVARLLKPCLVKGREYTNLKYGNKIKRVSRKWILSQIAGQNL
jgi:hypothetical protein